MAGRGLAAILVLVAALVTLVASGGAGAQDGDSIQCEGGTVITNTATAQTCEITASPGKCIEKSSSPIVVQTCIVNQSETDNEVYVLQVNTSKEQGSTQDSTQTTTVMQEGVNNRADVNQDIRQSTHASDGTITQSQNGHQITTICQGGAGDCATPNAGQNVANVQQSRWASAHASGGVIDQMQDVLGLGSLSDCAPAGAVTNPNLCASIAQNSEVKNDSDLHQDIHLLAEASGTPGANVTQKQGFATGGIEGHVMQPTTGTAQNTNDTHEHLTYDLSAPTGAMQVQDPRIGCCTPGKSKVNLHQVGMLRASENDAFQHLGINGVCLSSESCLILQNGKINGANFSTRCSAEGSCTANIECTSAGEIDSTSAVCTGFPEKGNPDDDLELASLGFDTLDFQDAINFQFPVTLETGGLTEGL